jgi:hypothetical protein
MTTINWCGYNPHGIRIAVIFPHPKGQWAVAGLLVNPWAPHDRQELRNFATLDAAKDAVAFRNPTTALQWKREDVEQAAPAMLRDKAS